jgi:PKD repeat protein
MMTRTLRSGCAAVLGAALCAWNCGSSPTTPSTPPAPAITPNTPPVIDQMAVVQSAYRTARLTASATDADGQVNSGKVDWGDGTTTSLTSGFASISMTHRYDRAQAYSVALSVADAAAASAESTRSVTITIPPEACLGVIAIQLCARSTADLRNLTVQARAGDVVLAGITISEGNPSVVLPLALGFGRLTLSHNFTTGRLTIGGEVCTVPFVVCQPVVNQAIQL